MVRKVLKASHTQHAQSPTISAVIFILTVPFQSCFGHSPTNGSHSLSLPKAGTHSPAPAKSHTAAYTAKHGAFFMGGGITTLRAFCAVRKPCAAGYQNGVLCRFRVLVRCAPEERREPSEQRCAHARRCSEASRPRRGALLHCCFSHRIDGLRGFAQPHRWRTEN